jgi:heptosyltransferase-1
VNEDPRNILYIKMSSMGDVVHGMPAAMALRRRFPLARITWLVDGRFADLVRGHPAVDEIIVAKAPAIPRMPLDHVLRASFQYAVAGELRRRGFDLVVDAQGLFRTGALCAMTGAGVRVGFANAREGAQIFYTRRIDVPREIHALERCLKLATALGADATPVQYGVAAGTEAAREMLRLAGLNEGEAYAVVAPKSARAEKDWPAERFAEVVRRLHERLALRVLVIGGKREEAVALEVAGESGTVFCGHPLAITVAAIAGAQLVLANDSGPLHLAAALNTPLIGLYGPTDPAKVGPYGNWQGVLRCDDGRIQSITVDDVWEKVQETKNQKNP